MKSDASKRISKLLGFDKQKLIQEISAYNPELFQIAIYVITEGQTDIKKISEYNLEELQQIKDTIEDLLNKKPGLMGSLILKGKKGRPIDEILKRFAAILKEDED